MMRLEVHGATEKFLAALTVLLVAGAVAALLASRSAEARTLRHRAACINNLRQIDGAKDQYAIDFGLTNGQAITFSNIVVEGDYIKKYPTCPAARLNGATHVTATNSYDIERVGFDPRCRIVTGTHRIESN